MPILHYHHRCHGLLSHERNGATVIVSDTAKYPRISLCNDCGWTGTALRAKALQSLVDEIQRRPRGRGSAK